LANYKITGVFQPSHCRGLLYDALHGWMTGWMDGKLHKKWMTRWMNGKLHKKRSQRPLIYVMSLYPMFMKCYYHLHPSIEFNNDFVDKKWMMTIVWIFFK
jgi:hypothetical protein